MKKDNSILFGKIIKPHGIKGELRIDLLNPKFEYNKKMESVFVEIDGKLVPFFIEDYSGRGPFGVLKLEGINTLEQAAGLHSKSLYINSKFIRSEQNSGPKILELLSFQVEDIRLGNLGVVTDIEEGAQERLVVKKGGREILIPFTKPLIKTWDANSKIILVDLPAGFLDIYE